MSTLPERHEKRCLNCSSLIYGRYCQTCGQENVQHKMTLFGMIKHFVFDLLHFDGKFFNTISTLFRQPGKVPLEYVTGKRVKYLEPFRMYIFCSTVFFIFFFSFFNNQAVKVKGDIGDPITATEANPIKDTIRNVTIVNGFYVDSFSSFAALQETYTKRGEGDKISIWAKLLLKKYYSYPPEIRGNSKYFGKLLSNEISHKFPQIIFCILPFFVGVLQLLYRKNKQYAYSDHGIFTLYMFSLTFIFILGVQMILWVLHYVPSSVIRVSFSLIFFFLYHALFFRALKRFYAQSWKKTFLKYLLLIFINFILALVIFLIYTILTFLIL